VASISVPSAFFFAIDTTDASKLAYVDYTSGSAPKTIQFIPRRFATRWRRALQRHSRDRKIRSGSMSRLRGSVPSRLASHHEFRAQLTVAEGTTRNLSWTIGQTLPTPVIYRDLYDTPIPYT